MKKLLFVVFFGYIFNPLCAASSIYYIPEGTVEERLREGIEYARHRVDICIHDFAALEITEYLDDARGRGVQVRVMMIEQEGHGAKGLLAETLIDRGIDVRILNTQLCGRPVQDFIILDDKLLVTGVYNWMAYRNRSICNDVVFYYNSEIVINYKDTFWRLFTDAEAILPASSKKDLVVSNNHHVPDTVASVKQVVRGDTSDKEQMAAAESPMPVTEVISGDFIDVSFEEMDKQFGKESTLSRSEKNELWKKYKGKYVRWQGVVAYKGMGRVDWNRVGVSRKSSKNAEVEILFDWRMFEKVMDVRMGNTIVYTGKLLSRPGINSPYRLDNGDIE